MELDTLVVHESLCKVIHAWIFIIQGKALIEVFRCDNSAQNEKERYEKLSRKNTKHSPYEHDCLLF